MKIEVAGLRTWWLGGVLAWAAAVWVATLFGLGARIAPAPANDRSAAALPALPPAAPERLASASAYADIGARPLFAEDRRPRPYLLGGSEPGASSSVRLTGVLLTPEFGMAILTTDQNQSVRLRLNGEAVNGWQLLALERRSATVSGPGGTQNLELPVFNGQGGQPPTVLGSQGTAGAGAQAVMVPPPPSPSPALPTTRNTPANVAAPMPGAAPAAAPAPAQQGPSDAQMKAIRERIQARRQQLQQQQQQQPPSQQPPAGGSGHNP